jgi:hypothetical protein
MDHSLEVSEMESLEASRWSAYFWQCVELPSCYELAEHSEGSLVERQIWLLVEPLWMHCGGCPEECESRILKPRESQTRERREE